MDIKIIVALVIVLFVFLFCIAFKHIDDDSSEYDEEHGYYTYAVIFYPDHKKSVEGFVDKFRLGNSTCSITINGVEYITAPEHIILTKKKQEFFKKEGDKNE